jgi:hypothetical protein
MGAAFDQPWITGDVDLIDKKGTTPLRGFEGYGWSESWIATAFSRTPEKLRPVAVGFGPGKSTIRSLAPKISSAGPEE